MRTVAQSRIFLAIACASGLGVLGGNAAMAGNASYDTALANTPCEIVSADMVAAQFDVPQESLQQVKPSETWCSYMMEADGKILEVTFLIVPYDTDKAAADAFEETTRSMSRDEMAAEVKKNLIDEDDPKGTFEKMTATLPTNGIQFEDVEGLDDAARFETSFGTLNIQRGNFLMKLTAYYGPSMKMPDPFTIEALTKANAEWSQRNMDARKQMAIDLAKTALAEL